jgi:hypothetical protein
VSVSVLQKNQVMFNNLLHYNLRISFPMLYCETIFKKSHFQEVSNGRHKTPQGVEFYVKGLVKP